MTTVVTSTNTPPQTRRINEVLLRENPAIASFYSGVYAWAVEDGQIFIVIVPSVRIQEKRNRPGEMEYCPTQYKLPGGNDNGACEYPWEAAAREFGEEVLKPRSKIALSENSVERYFHFDKPDQSDSALIHRQIFWMLNLRRLENFKGTVHYRKKVLKDPDRTGKGYELLLPPTYLDLDQLSAGILCYSHLRALAAGIIELAKDASLVVLIPGSVLEWATDLSNFKGPSAFYRR